MTAGVLLGMNQLEIHGKWWYLFHEGIWVYIGVRTCDVFSSLCYLILGSGCCLTFSSLLVFFDKPDFTPSKNVRVCNVCISISERSVASIVTLTQN